MDKDRLLFVKEGRARFISHLDLMRTFQRAFLRADIAIKHTEGFNPHPFISIVLPLSVGFSSQCELLEFVLLPGTDREEVPGRLNAVLPEGVRVISCYEGGRPVKGLETLDYRIDLSVSGDPGSLKTAWSALLDRESWPVEKKSKKAKSGSVTIDIAQLVKDHSFADTPDGLSLVVRLSAQTPGLNPQVLVGALEETSGIHPAFVGYHRVEVYDGDGKPFR